MNIKSLLLGSAAAMAVVSGASAADAIIAAEPEPVEYVRVCDAFGSGYFYIPGTETCLKFGGYVRFRVFGDDDADSYDTFSRGELNIDSKSDTEMGTLHGHIRFRGDVNTATTAATGAFAYTNTMYMDQGYLQLGGLFAGFFESAWATTTNAGASGYGGHGIYDGAYGFQQFNQLQYQFNGGNWFGAISLEDDGDSGSWTPNIVGRLGAVIGGITVYGVVGYDQNNGAVISPAGTDEWGVKLGANADIGSAGNLIVQGFYASGFTAYGAVDNGLTAEWSVLASYQHTLSSTLNVHIGGQYFADLYTAANVQTGADAYRIIGGFAWTPVTNFRVRTDVEYSNIDAAAGTAASELDDWRWVIELQRSF
jgi:hypothetical protein